MYKTSAEGVEYSLEMDGDPPTTSRNFQYAVDSLEYEGDYYHLFQVFGLHYPTSVVFGARYGHADHHYSPQSRCPHPSVGTSLRAMRRQ